MRKIVIVGSGVAGINAATELVDNGYPGENIILIDKGKDPFNRKPEEVMTGMLGAGGWSDGKLTYHTSIGGQLSKYCGEEGAMRLMDKVIDNFKRFHPFPEQIMKSVIPVVMAGIIAIYGLVVAVLISGNVKTDCYKLKTQVIVYL